MKITMNKELTESYMVDRTKAQMKEFKAMYTDGDLLRMFRDAVPDERLGWNWSILRCELSAFPGGWAETDETHYHVKMLLEGFQEFVELSFFITQSGAVDTRVVAGYVKPMLMYEVRHYKLA